MNPLERDFIVSICKKIPPMTCDVSVTQWFNTIHGLYNTDVRLKPELACQLTWIWLNSNKGILIQNVESCEI